MSSTTATTSGKNCTCVRRLSSSSGMHKHPSSPKIVAVKGTSPAKIVNPLEVYAKQKLEEANAHKVAWEATRHQREAAEKAQRVEKERRMRMVAERAAKRESTREKKRLEMDTRMARLHTAYAQQQAGGVSYPLTVGGCAKFVRSDEEVFFQDHHVPRSSGQIICFTCGRDKYPKLRHEPNNPVDETFPCFMCSQQVGWVYCCPNCSWHMRV